MEGAFKSQNLYGDFNVDLEPFIPDTDPQGGAALPPQPMPNAQVLQTAQMQAPGNMNQGLTQIENALLVRRRKTN